MPMQDKRGLLREEWVSMCDEWLKIVNFTIIAT